MLISACRSSGAVPAAETASDGARSAAHPCFRPGADSGTPDRTIRYDDELATGTEPGAVVGHVFDLDGNPLVAVPVGLEALDDAEDDQLTQTDSAGHFAFTDVAPEGHVLVVWRLGFLDQTQHLQILPGRTDTICVALRSVAMYPPDIPLPR